MTVLEAITDAYLLATGKSTLPTSGSAKYDRLFNLAKKFYRSWQKEKGTDWDSLYEVVGAGTVTATDTFEIDTEIIKVSQRKGDYIRIVCTNGNTIPFKLVPASKLYEDRYANVVAKIGLNLKFSRTFSATDQEFGGTVEVPAYIKLDDLASESDDVLIDDPDWLPVVIAAQYVLSDAQLSYQYPDLLQQAQDLMDGMKLANNPQEETYTSDEDYFNVGLGPSGC